MAAWNEEFDGEGVTIFTVVDALIMANPCGGERDPLTISSVGSAWRCRVGARAQTPGQPSSQSFAMEYNRLLRISSSIGRCSFETEACWRRFLVSGFLFGFSGPS